jgi:hypothetical protein
VRQGWLRDLTCLAFLFALALDSIGCAVRYQKQGLGHFLPSVKAPDQVDCGSVRVPMTFPLEVDAASLPSITDCVNGALQQRQPFFFVVQGPGIDSYMATGLVGDASGNVKRFWYDSAPCGGPHCRERFTVWPCSPNSHGVPVAPNEHCHEPLGASGGRTKS